MSTLLFRIGRFAALHPGRMIGLWLVVAALVVVTSGAWGAELDDEFSVPGVDSQIATELLSDAGNDRAGLTASVVVASPDGSSTTLSDPSKSAAIDDLRSDLESLDSVVGVAPTQISPDGRVGLLTIQYPILEELDASDVDRLIEVVEGTDAGDAIDVEVGGDLLQAFDDGGGDGAEMIGLAVAVIVLLVAFGSVIAMGLPIGMALAGLALGVSAMALVAHLIEVPSWAPQMGTMIGLGVGIDYALFVVTRHRENLADGRSIVDAAAHANATAGHSVVFAGGTVVIAILGLAFAGVPFMTAAGVATSVIVAVMVIASVTLLPALLGLVGHRIDRWSVRRQSNRTDAGRAAVGTGWQRWGEHVSRHAAGYAVGVTALLLALTAPVLALQLGFPDAGSLPDSRTERRAYDLVADGFGPGANGPLVVAVDLGQSSESVDPAVVDVDAATSLVDDLSAAIAADSGVASVAPAEVDLDAGVATIVAFPSTAPQDDATYETVQRLRADVIPAALAGGEAGASRSTVSAHVGGQTATFGDVADRVGDRLLLFISAVVALSFLLLTVVFRSVLVAAKAALLNLLSIGAAYGVLVAVFQWGWGMSLFGLESTVPIVSFIPMFMFAVLFGLSMDYEVFLLSRVREEYRATGDNDRSVIHGIAVTARVITSAALIMISVFGGFVLGEDPILKMMGLGLATAILVDATIVRLVLVPATMTLLGDRNWWLPGWLDRVLPHVDVDGPVATPPAGASDAARPDRELVDA
ncbi:MAG: MMPL family transporter [Actinomycetota bacterium]